MNDHNLDDLIIDEAQPAQSNKAKSFLTIIALAIVVLIVSIIFTKVMLKAPKQDQLLFEQNETEVISPDLTLQSSTETVETTSNPLESTTDETSLSIAKETEEIPTPADEALGTPEESEKPAVEEMPMADKEPENEPVANTETVEKEEEPAPAPMPETEAEKSTDILNIVEEPATKEKTDIVPQQKVHQSTNKTIEQSVQKYRPANVITRPNENHTNYVSGGKYYIQVGAFSNDPGKRFLDKITTNGFNYTVTKRSPSGLKKVLIGPYSDQKSAENALIKVRKLINERAFLLRKK